MAQAKFVHEGLRIDYTPGSAVVAGQVVVQGDLIGVSPEPIAANALGALIIEGVFEFAKASGTIAVGVLLYWDDSAGQVTATPGAHKLIGPCTKAALTGDTTVEVALDPPGPYSAFGYTTGAGGAETQSSSKATGVTISPATMCGTITTAADSLAGAAEIEFVVTNSLVKATDVVVVAIKSGGYGGTGTYIAWVTAVAAGTFNIALANVGATASEAVVINWAIIPSVAA